MNKRLFFIFSFMMIASLIVIANCEDKKEVHTEKHAFETEVSKLMGILINSLYTNKEVFLRELISNASDALDKLRFLALTDSSLLGTGEAAKLDIKIKYDAEKGTLTITDKGIGMTKKELAKNLGTIAHSGTTEFFKSMESTKDASNLIGQFGVGFYSAFLVADTVTVSSKSNNDTEQWVWESNAGKEYTISKEENEENKLERGTRITLHLKEDAKPLLSDAEKLKIIVRKYSEFITFPIYVWSSKEVEEVVPVPEEELKAEEKKPEEEEEEIEPEGGKKEEEKKEKTKTIKKTVYEYELVNNVKPLWTRNPKEITEEEYNSFYKAITRASEDPLLKTHFVAEGDANFRSILYIPKLAPHTIWDPNPSSHKHSLKLYVRRVFITSDFFEIVPAYMRFLRGIVDSDDMPLNVSREQLQESKILEIIKKKIVRKAIAMFQELFKTNKEKYLEFFEEYGTGIKIGVIDDYENRERLSKLLVYYSSSTKNMTSLDEYISRMKKGQKEIFYLSGDSAQQLEKSPVCERLLKNNYEILFLTHPVDEYTLSQLSTYGKDKIKLTNLARESSKLDFIDEEKEKVVAEDFKKVIEYMKTVLGEKVEKVIISHRLATSPSALVANSYSYTANMERMHLSQPTRNGNNGKKAMQGMMKKVLEINPSHPIIKDIAAKIEKLPEKEKEENKEPTIVQKGKEEEELELAIKILYQSSVVSGGFVIEDPMLFAVEIQKLLASRIGVNPEQPVEVLDLEKVKTKEEEEKEKEEEEKEKEEKKEEKKDEEEEEEKEEL